MKTAKRITSVILLAVILWAVGYLVFMGCRLPFVFTEEVTEEPIMIETTDTYEGSVTDEPTTEIS